MGSIEANIHPVFDKIVTITLIGNPGTGKTSNRLALLGKSFQINEVITVGSEYTFHKMILNRKKVEMKICDIAEQTAYGIMRSNYMANSDAVIVVFDIAIPIFFLNIVKWVRKNLQANKQAKTNLPVLLVANEMVLVDKLKVKLKDLSRLLKEVKEESILSSILSDTNKHQPNGMKILFLAIQNLWHRSDIRRNLVYDLEVMRSIF